MISVDFPGYGSPRSSSTPTHSKLSRRGLRLARPWLDLASSRVNARIPLLETILARVDETLSLHRILARVTAVRRETHDVNTYVLRPNARFGSFRPGAHVNVHVTIDGRPVQRSYSLSSAPARDGTITITVKRVPGGLVSNYLADTIARGDVLELGAPTGHFTLPEQTPEQLLLISAGSGITPVMSMLRHLVASDSRTRVTFLHFARTPRDVIFAEELADIARRWPNLSLALCAERADATWPGHTGLFRAELLERVAPEFRELDTFLCGPAGFMRSVMQTLEGADADLSKLRYELFSAEFDVSALLERSRLVRFARSNVESISTHPLTILQHAEAKGLRVETGCRAGTCGTCRCKKKSGVVLNLATNRESSAGEEMICPCVSVPQGAVDVEL